MRARTLKKRIQRVALVLVILLCAVALRPHRAQADVATDTLTIRVGYSGMDLSEYVELKTYTWADMIEHFSYDSVVYSYFQGRESLFGEGLYSSYTCILDSANGVYLTDLINDAKIYYGDIYNILFYVEDHATIWCAFDRDELFGRRYYYENMPGHRTVYYNSLGRPYAYSFEEAADYGWQVEPMMAFEDNWAAFSEDFENIYEDFSYLNTANRFRLLFGQSYPTESLTSKSAKYVSTIYITLYGKPRYTNIPALDGTMGSHEVELTVDVDNQTLRNALSELMRLTSTNEEVLRVTGMTVVPDDYFENLATVRISYEIVGEGTAEILPGFGSLEMGYRSPEGEESAQNVSIAVDTSDFAPTPDKPEEPAKEQGDDGENGGATSDDAVSATSEQPSAPVAPEESSGGNDSADSTLDGRVNGSASLSGSRPSTAEASGDTARPVSTGNIAEAMAGEETQSVASAGADAAVPTGQIVESLEISEIAALRRISDAAASDLADLFADEDAAREMALYSLEAPDTEINQLTIEDNSEEKELRRRHILMATAIACALLALLGGASSYIRYRLLLIRERLFLPRQQHLAQAGADDKYTAQGR